jgi:hypothetical protein
MIPKLAFISRMARLVLAQNEKLVIFSSSIPALNETAELLKKALPPPPPPRGLIISSSSKPQPCRKFSTSHAGKLQRRLTSWCCSTFLPSTLKLVKGATNLRKETL